MFLVFGQCQNITTTNLDKKMDINTTYPPLKDYLSNDLKLELADLSIRDFSESYNWLEGKKLFCVFNFMENTQALLLLEDKKAGWIHLNQTNASKFFSFLKPLTLSADLSSFEEVRSLAETIFQLYQDPRGELIDDLFIKRNEEVLFSYLSTDTDNTDLLRLHGKKISYSKKGDGWQLNFNVMNKDGGIYNWDVLIGDKTESVNITQLEKDGTFYFPNEY